MKDSKPSRSYVGCLSECWIGQFISASLFLCVARESKPTRAQADQRRPEVYRFAGSGVCHDRRLRCRGTPLQLYFQKGPRSQTCGNGTVGISHTLSHTNVSPPSREAILRACFTLIQLTLAQSEGWKTGVCLSTPMLAKLLNSVPRSAFRLPRLEMESRAGIAPAFAALQAAA